MAHVFLSGNLALDLAGTLKWRDSRPEELLRTPEDLDDWLVAGGVLDAPAPSGEHDLVAARLLREAVYEMAVQHMRSERCPARAGDVVNRAAAFAPATWTLVEGRVARTGDTTSALAMVAREAIDVLGRCPAAAIKRCNRPTCTRVFVDRSPAGRRTWCGMAECGSRVKAARYRSRKRAARG